MQGLKFRILCRNSGVHHAEHRCLAVADEPPLADDKPNAATLYEYISMHYA